MTADPEAACAAFVEVVGALPARIWLDSVSAAVAEFDKSPALSDTPFVCFYRGTVEAAANDTEAARISFEQAAAHPSAELWVQLDAHAGLIELAHRTGQLTAARVTSVRGYEIAKARVMHGYAALFAARAAEISGMLGEVVDSEHYRSLSVAELDAVGDPLTAGRIHLVIAHNVAFLGDYTGAATHFEMALRRWEEAHYAHGVAQVQSGQAWIGWLTERVRWGLRQGMSAYEYFAAADDDYNRGLAALNVAELYRIRNDFEDALRWGNIALQSLSNADGVLYRSICLYRIGRVHVEMGRPAEAIPFLRTSIELQSSVVHEAFSLGLASLVLADALVSTGDPLAAEAVDVAESRLLTARTERALAVALIGTAILRRRLGLAQVESGLRRGLEVCESAGYDDLLASAHGELARLKSSRGQMTVCGRHLAQAIVNATRHGPYSSDREIGNAAGLARDMTAPQRARLVSSCRSAFASSHVGTLSLEEHDSLRRSAEADPSLAVDALSRLVELLA